MLREELFLSRNETIQLVIQNMAISEIINTKARSNAFNKLYLYEYAYICIYNNNKEKETIKLQGSGRVHGRGFREERNGEVI